MKYKKLITFEDKNSKTEEENKKDESEPGTALRNIEDLRFISLYGEINEQNAARITSGLIAFKEQKKIIFNKKNPNEFIEFPESLEFMISTPGGSAHEMYSIYDTMRLVKKEGMDIKTIGIGKIMSAGVLLLAAGTKGLRCIGKNCHVMIHSVNGDIQGPLYEIGQEYKEMLKTQRKYINCLSKESKMTMRQIKDFIDQRKNIYLSAQESVKLGIVDNIF